VTPTKIYWDSVVFIDLIEETPGRISRLQSVIERAMKQEVVIVTCALTMVEVVKLKNLNLLDEDAERRVTEFFENAYISVRNVDRFVAEAARPIVRKDGIKPPDAIHVATAILSKVEVLHTFDQPLLKQNGKVDGLRIEEP
jgi:predicted nucleic acid-binding protein